MVKTGSEWSRETTFLSLGLERTTQHNDCLRPEIISDVDYVEMHSPSLGDLDRIVVIHRPAIIMMNIILLSNGPPNPCPRPVLHLGHPHGGSGRRRQQEKEVKHGNDLQDHCHGAKPQILPSPQSELAFNLLFVETS
jgi:hypothetical protein